MAESEKSTWFWKVVKTSGFLVFAVNVVNVFFVGRFLPLPIWVPTITLFLTAFGFISFVVLLVAQPMNLPRPFLYHKFKGFIFSVAILGVVVFILFIVYFFSWLLSVVS